MPLFVVATPIGNLEDMSPRVLETLRQAELILAEDTKRTAKLLTLCGINKTTSKHLIRCDSHKEQQLCNDAGFVNRLRNDTNIVIVSDAGSPTISDPGAAVVRLAHKEKISVIPIPGPCAAIAALSVSGYSSSSFFFGGYFPSASVARKKFILEHKNTPHPSVYYESPHRIKECLQDLCELCGEQRHALLARELTKTYQTICSGTLAEIREHLENNESKGEITLVLAGFNHENEDKLQDEDEHVLRLLLDCLPVNTATDIAAQIRKKSKKLFYRKALEYKDGKK